MIHAGGPIAKDLVLIGGGHAHVAVLKSFGMRSMAGLRVTLISKEAYSAYSGMLPGFIAGHYTFDDAHIDLPRLCHFAGAQFYQAAVTGLDLENKKVLCAGRPPITFDVLSLNIGSGPRLENVPGAREFAVPIKPIEKFLHAWENILRHSRDGHLDSVRIVVVGGGAGGVELLLSVRQRLLAELTAGKQARVNPEFHLVTDAVTLLPTHNPGVQNAFARIFRERKIAAHLSSRVVAVERNRLQCESGATIPFDILIWATSAAPAGWLRSTGLQTNADGFVVVNEMLQSVSHPFVFAAGDVAALPDSRPKSGVFAVRAGPPLSRNLRLALLEQNLKKFSPQRAFLSLISTGDRCAVASRGSWSVRGKWVWRWKEWIDRNWMQKYQQLPPVEMQPASDAASTRDADASVPNEMRCGGCGAKIGSTVLTRVLRRLEPVSRGDVMIDLKSPDDAATSRVPSDRVVVQTVDFFRSFVSDPFVFGKIAANHALGDIYAMGAEPQLALAIAVVPIGAEAKVEEQLFQMLAGATTILNAHGTTLAGGHSAEGLELALGLSVQGMADPSRLLRKGGLKAGDALILTKPLGTGTLFAAAMRRRAEARWIETAIASMLVSNRAAADCFLRHEATACTDITGFGLLGHLLEMATASVVRVEIELARLPILPGATATLAAGIESSLQPENLQLDRFIENRDAAAKQKMFEILFDPQTAGGLLASVPGDEADACVAALVERGYAAAAIIGRVMGSEKSATPIIIR